MAKQQQIKINEVYHYTPSLQNSLNSVISFSKTGVGIAPKKSNNRNKFFFSHPDRKLTKTFWRQ